MAGCFICCAKPVSADFLPEKPSVVPSAFPRQPVQRLTRETAMPHSKHCSVRRAEHAGLPEVSHVPRVSLDLENLLKKNTTGLRGKSSEKLNIRIFHRSSKDDLCLVPVYRTD